MATLVLKNITKKFGDFTALHNVSLEIREGEYVGRDRRTKRPEFDFSIYATDEEAEKHPIVGYYAYVEKRDGFFRSEYMSIGAILDHAEQYSKTFDKIPTPDVAISMGCDVGCPFIGREFDDNWGLPDPTGKSDGEFIKVIEEIKKRIMQL